MTGDQASSASPSAAAAREAALHEILAVLRDSRDDEKPVFDAILRNAQTLCDAPMAGLVLGTAEDAVQSLAAHIGVQPQTIEMFESGRMLMDGGISHSARSILEARTVVFDDMGASDLYVAGSPVVRAMVDESGIRSVLFAPLVRGGAAIGTITLFRHDVDPFDADEIALVESFAAQAVIAIENVRQFRELQTRLERETATREILHVISQTRDDERPVFEEVLRSARRLCGAESAALLLGRADGGTLTLAALDDVDAAHAANREAIIAEVNATPRPLDPELHLAARAILTGETLQIEDLADTHAYRVGEPTRRIMVDEQGLRTALTVPLFVRDEAVGAINLHRRERRPFSPEDVALVQTFAAQAAIAIENARQFRELQTRLEREAATREILEVISTSRDDEKPVFDAILRNAQRLCGAPFGNLSMVSPDGARLEIKSDGIAPFEPFRPGWSWPIESGLLVARSVRETAVLQLEDAAEDPIFAQGDPDRVTVVEAGVRTVLTVPLLSGGAAIGSMALFRRERRPFSADEIALVETFAAQAVIAIENVRQFRELQERLERERATGEVLDVIARSRDDEAPVFEAVLENVARLCNAPTALLGLVTEDGARYTLAAAHGARQEMVERIQAAPIPLDPDRFAVARAIVEERTVRVDDLADPDLYGADDEVRRESVGLDGIRSAVCVPLLSKAGAIGALFIYRREVAPFSDADVALLETFAAQAVIAIENVRQFRELQTRLEREAATRRILEVISGSRDDEGPVFDAILEAACRLCDAPLAYLVMADGGSGGGGEGGDDDRRVRCPARRGAFVTFGDTLDRLSVQVDSRLALVRSFVEGRVIRIDDIADDDLYRAGDPNRVSMVEDEGARSILVAPLMRGDVGLGSITLYRREVRPFSDDDVALVEAFAAQAVIAIETVRQFKALEALNAELGERVEEQVDELERMGRLKRFLSPQVAQAITSAGDEGKLSSHRALVAVLFADIRGFTAFCETAEPEETIEVLQTYHEEMGRLLHEHGAGVDHRSGDGIMAIFNDPLPCEDPAGDAVRLAVAMRAQMADLCRGWRRLGHRLGFGVGVSLGYATVGMVGSEGRYDYTASGTAVNLGARLCDRAADGEILLSPRAAAAVEEDFSAESVGEIDFKGIREPVEVFRLAAPPEA